MKRYIIPIILISLTFSCRKEINIDIPDNERKIVLNTIIMADSVFSANVFRSNHAQDKNLDFLYLNNATVNIFENGSLLESLPLDYSGFYKGNTAIAQEGHEYEIAVTVPDLKPVTAKDKVLSQIPITSIDYIGQTTNENYYYYYESEPETYTTFDVKFKDLPSIKNYYRLKIKTLSIADTTFYYDNDLDSLISEINYTQQHSYSEDPTIEIWDWRDGYYYFSDVLFDGEEYGFEVNIAISDDKDSDKPHILLEHISYDFYRYMMSIDMQSETQGMELFYQAAPVFVNIKDGFGILGTANASKEYIP